MLSSLLSFIYTLKKKIYEYPLDCSSIKSFSGLVFYLHFIIYIINFFIYCIKSFVFMFKEVPQKRPVDTTKPWTNEEIVGVFLLWIPVVPFSLLGVSIFLISKVLLIFFPTEVPIILGGDTALVEGFIGSSSIDPELVTDISDVSEFADYYNAKNAALISKLARLHFSETERLMALSRANNIQGRFRNWLFKK